MCSSWREFLMRLSSSSSSVCDNFMATKLQNQSNSSSVRVPSAVSLTGKRFLTNLRHHHASSSFTGKTDTKLSRAYPMKNLCLRRVFSPSSFSSDWDFHVKGENQTKEVNLESRCDSPNSNVMGEGHIELCGGLLVTRDDLEEVEFSQTTPKDTEMFTGESSLVKDGTKLESKGIRRRHLEKVFKNPGSVSYRRLLPYLMEAADVTRDVDAKDLKNERGETMAAKDRVLETSPVLHVNSSPLKKMISSNTNKISLSSRRKLYRVPGSVNYRRMLSYLKENSKVNPGTPKHIDLQKNIEENDPATENNGASTEARFSNTCSNNVEAPL